MGPQQATETTKLPQKNAYRDTAVATATRVTGDMRPVLLEQETPRTSRVEFEGIITHSLLAKQKKRDLAG